MMLLYNLHCLIPVSYTHLKNAHKYGFILRYPKDRSSFTGIANEPWHFRYVGKKIAKIIYDNDWILEDYILKYGFDYELKMIR